MAQQALAGVGKARSHRGPLYECRACPVLCDKRSMVTHIVAKHLQVREAPYFCTVCDTKYVGRRDWQRHRTDAHHRARCAMRPKLPKGCMGINPDGVALEGPSARAISLPKEEADRYWALVAAAKDAPLDLDKDTSSGSESEEEPDQPAPQGGDSPHQPDRTTPDHFVFDVSHQEEITTPSREVPAMTEDLESTPGSSKSPRTGKASSPPLTHSQKRKKSVASTVAPVVATAVPLVGTSSTAQSHESDDMSSPPPTHNTQKRKKSVSSAVAPAMPSFMPQAETVHPHAPEPSGSTSQPVAGPSNAASVPSPPSLDTEEWARVYTRMAEVVGAAVREGLAAGFEFFG